MDCQGSSRDSRNVLAQVCLESISFMVQYVDENPSFCLHNPSTILNFDYILLHADCLHGAAVTKEWNVRKHRENFLSFCLHDSVLLCIAQGNKCMKSMSPLLEYKLDLPRDNTLLFSSRNLQYLLFWRTFYVISIIGLLSRLTQYKHAAVCLLEMGR